MQFDQKRREFITLLGGAAACPLAARAQQTEHMRRIGVLMPFTADDLEARARLAAFMQALQQLGWTDGHNVRIDTRWSGLNASDTRKFAAELVALAPNVILTMSSVTVAALLQVTRTIPIVFTIVVDPVGAGYVDSLARPGGNATGFTVYEYSMSGKWPELLKEIAPSVTRAVVLRDSAIASGPGQFAGIQGAASSLGVELRPVDVRDAGEIERAIAVFAQSTNSGMIVTGSTGATAHRELIIALAARHRLPRGLQQSILGCRRWSNHLRTGFPGLVPARCRLCRSHSQGREARRPAGAGADQVRACHQSDDRKGARPRCAADAARPRRRGDRIAVQPPISFAAVHESGYGTKRRLGSVRFFAAYEG
jgi:putative tryptophan/tyrosine transport system substrate-binding protein